MTSLHQPAALTSACWRGPRTRARATANFLETKAAVSPSGAGPPRQYKYTYAMRSTHRHTYIHVYIHTFKCFLAKYRKAFYRSAYALFVKISYVACEARNSFWANAYDIEACYLTKSKLSLLDFVVNRFVWNYSEKINLNTAKNVNYILGITYQMTQTKNEPGILTQFTKYNT